MSNSIDISDLVHDVSLIDIAVLELSATRARKETGNEDLAEGFNSDEYDVETDFSLKLANDLDSDKKFRVQVTTSIESTPGKIYIEMAADYSLEALTTGEIDSDLILDFANRVAFMTLLPYIRQTVADISQRVFIQPLTMPIFKAGDLVFS